MQSRLHAMRLLKRGRSRDGALLSPSSSPRGSVGNIFNFQEAKTLSDGQGLKCGRRFSSPSCTPPPIFQPPTTKQQLKHQEDCDFASVARIMYLFLAVVTASVVAFIVYTVVNGSSSTVMGMG